MPVNDKQTLFLLNLIIYPDDKNACSPFYWKCWLLLTLVLYQLEDSKEHSQW